MKTVVRFDWDKWKLKLDEFYRKCVIHRHVIALDTLDYVYDLWQDGFKIPEMISLLNELWYGEEYE